MGQALYRKYRSKSLGELVGQEHITQALASAVKSGRISHAYLFTGPHGVGKTSVARILAHEINQLPYTDQPQLDIIEIDAASNRRIDDIRDLRDKVHIAPVSAKFKVYIIDEVHMLTGESFNALLKTLEEPPAHVVFILATTEAHKLPTTIVSRTQRYAFRPVSADKVIAHLKNIAKQEKIAVTDEALEVIAEHGEGSFRDSIGLLDQLANLGGGEQITAELVEQHLGRAPRAALQSLVTAILQKDTANVTAQLDALETTGVTPATLVPQLLSTLQTNANSTPQLYHLIDALLEVPRAYNPQVKLLTTLVRFTLDGPAPKPEPQRAAALQATKPVLEVAAQPVTPKKSSPAPAKTKQPLDALEPNKWQAVLLELKKINPQLFGLAKQTEPLFDADSQTLELRCKYQLHQKRLDDAKAKSALGQAFMTALGAQPMFTIAFDKQAAAPTLNLEAAPVAAMDATSKSVAAIMGGGEVVAEA